MDIEFDKGRAPHMDLRDPDVQNIVLHAMHSHARSMAAGVNCRSFSPLRDMLYATIRRRGEDMGVADVPEEWRTYLSGENTLILFTARAAWLMHDLDRDWFVENPADLGDPGSTVFREGRRDSAHLYRTAPMVELRRGTGAVFVGPFAQCYLGALGQKLTTLLCAMRFAARIWWFNTLVSPPLGCACGKHSRPAIGRRRGVSQAAQAAAWPPLMCETLADSSRGLSRPAAFTPGDSGGKVVDGIHMHPAILRAVEEARWAPLRYASRRYLQPASAAQLAAMPMPVMPLPAPTSTALGGDEVGASDGDDLGGSDTSEEGDEHPPLGQLDLFQIPKRRSAIRLRKWLVDAESTLLAWADGRPHAGPGTCTITQKQTRAFARGKRYDARVSSACVELTRSTASTEFPGGKQLDRARFREAAAAHGWAGVDPDIVEQCGGGGVESRSSRGLTTTLRLHHPGVRENFRAVNDAISKELEQSFAGCVVGHLIPFYPTNAMPRDFIFKDSYKVGEDGELVLGSKGRVTFDPSSGALPLNGGVSHEERTTGNPSVRDLGRGAAIVHAAAQEAGLSAVLYGADISSAYPHLVLQRLEWCLHCFVWVCLETRRLRVCWFYRMAFGGAYAPQRFNRALTLIDAEGARRVAAFDAAQPPPAPVRAWCTRRRERQAAEMLPPGDTQTAPAFSQRFVDDKAGAADSGVVSVPARLAHIPLGAALTRALGGAPAHPASRGATHLRIHVDTWTFFGLTPEHEKTVCGDQIISLGARISIPRERIDCPPVRVQTIGAQCIEVEAQVTNGAVCVREVGSLTGRLNYVSQFEPDLTGLLNGGYAIANVSVARRAATGGRGRGLPRLRMNARSGATARLLAMTSRARELMAANVGSPLASAPVFPGIFTPGLLVSSTDASSANRDDGVGGFVFEAAFPRHVTLVSEAWPPAVKAALISAARTRSEKRTAPHRQNLSMPAAEAFGIWAVPAAAAAVRPGGRAPICGVASIGDCDPAASAFNRGKSPRPQVNDVVQAAKALTTDWLAVSVPRDFNLSADDLSHPSRLGRVCAEAEAAGFVVVVAAIPRECWRALHTYLSSQTDAAVV